MILIVRQRKQDGVLMEKEIYTRKMITGTLMVERGKTLFLVGPDVPKVIMSDNHGAMAKHTTINHWDHRSSRY